MEELLKMVQYEFDRVRGRNDKLSSALMKIKTITNNDETSDTDKVREIRNFVEEYIERFI